MNSDTRDLANDGKLSSTAVNSKLKTKREPGEITQLFRIVEDKIVAENIDDEVQIELAIVVSLLAKMEKSGSVGDNKRYLEIALKSLASERPNLSFVRGLRTELELNSEMYSRGLPRLIKKIAGPTPLSAMIAGLSTTLILSPFIYGILIFFFGDRLENYFSVTTVIVLTGAAFLGGVVSLLSRLEEFAALRLYNPNLIFFTAFFKPFIGVALTLFVYSIFDLGLIKVSGFNTDGVEADKQYLLVWVIGFLCGFSERFTRDIVGRVETRIVPADKKAS
jgi:hypothetical protein